MKILSRNFTNGGDGTVKLLPEEGEPILIPRFHFVEADLQGWQDHPGTTLECCERACKLPHKQEQGISLVFSSIAFFDVQDSGCFHVWQGGIEQLSAM